MQPLLPFPNLNIPAKHLTWLQQANAGDYPEKKFWFYPLKTRLLRAHAITDGLDLQVIVLKCWCGDGIWRGRDDDLPKQLHQPCYKCNGTGIYLTKKIVLIRWLLNGLIFHEPSTLITYRAGVEYKHTYDGLIKHSEIPQATSRRAMEKLMLRYEPKTFYNLWLSRWRDWSQGKVYRAKFQIRRVRFLLSRKTEESEVPF